MKICKIYFNLFFFMFLSLFMLGILFLISDYFLILEFNLLSLNSLVISMVILLDWMSLLFMSFVLLISSLVIFYSEEYMENEKSLNRFILLVVMFVFSMMLLIISPNLVSILLGWDGLGLVSYCLVIYYQNIRSLNAGMLTVLVNRVGDVAFLMAIAWMMNFGSWNYVFYLNIMKNDMIMQLIVMLIILASFTKSAQIPFSAWLPAAMAAPTPVSSLVHSSTLVTAGVYLLIRFNFALLDYMMYIMLFLSLLTMFMSGLGANYEFDLKKIIALSTLSQLGLMLSILCLGGYKLSFFHLLTHALFKALLFMCAGVIIHNFNDCQDIRFMGGLINHMPLTCTYFNICNFSLCGLPFLSGFYSKDLIVEFMMMNYLNFIVYLIFYISLGLTVSYSMRLTYYLTNSSMNFNPLSMFNESSYIMLKGMSGLIILVIMMGSILNWLILVDPVMICLSWLMKLMTLLMVFLGGYLGLELSKFKFNYLLKSLFYKKSSYFYFSMWNLGVISTLGVNYYPIYLSEKYFRQLDLGWFEFYGSKHLVIILSKFIQFFQFFSKNYISMYFILLMVIFLFNVMI
uniref:NADH dehydrogenase subunit 5 n=1 Tax=Lema decempunctata TaxID=1412118 RepID=UPI0022A7DA09|nr:NADH dehydrogenase subunit 5 [Lema decempunctata]UZS91164.1 NADH dehydrogenase subunit 5 [Lema decempunctata]